MANKVIVTDRNYKWNKHCITDKITLKEFKSDILPELKSDNIYIRISNPIYRKIYGLKNNVVNIPPFENNTVIYCVGLYIVRVFYFDKDEPHFKGL